MIVLDASVLADALIDDGPVGERARESISQDLHWAAPAHLVVEVVSVVRGRVLGGKLTVLRAEEAIDALADLEIAQIDVQPLTNRIWQLRENLTAYDAAYVAVAEQLDCRLYTSDARLARARDLGRHVRLIR
ncbi:MAG: type II toxin-antitoxin system VapC family toxin [Jatrophihabitantaceae bacterium]